MKPILLLAAPLLLVSCTQAARSIDAEIDADFEKGEVLLTCKASSSGACYAVFVADGQAVEAQAAAGAASSVQGVAQGADYCVDVATPDLSKCHPRPLVAGKQIFRGATVKR